MHRGSDTIGFHEYPGPPRRRRAVGRGYVHQTGQASETNGTSTRRGWPTTNAMPTVTGGCCVCVCEGMTAVDRWRGQDGLLEFRYQIFKVRGGSLERWTGQFAAWVVWKIYMRRFTSTVPARSARALNRAISNSCL